MVQNMWCLACSSQTSFLEHQSRSSRTTFDSSSYQTRKQFCMMYKAWLKQQWHNVIFSDEMNIELDKRKCRVLISSRLPQEKYNTDCILQRTKQCSGSIRVWACMGHRGDVFFKMLTERLKQFEYIPILSVLPASQIYECRFR